MVGDTLELTVNQPDVIELILSQPKLELTSPACDTIEICPPGEQSNIEITTQPQNLELTITEPDDLTLTVTTETIELSAPVAVGTGEANTGQNCGVSGAGVFHQKTGVILEFRSVRSLSNEIEVAENVGDCTVDLTFKRQEKCEIEPSGTKDGANLTYSLPDFVLPDTFKLYRNGLRLRRDQGGSCDFSLSESGGAGTGFDTVTITDAPLESSEELTADYTVKF